MASRALEETSSQATTLSASVCVVGAGIAGLIAATRLARDKRLRVIVIESGPKNIEPAVTALNEIDDHTDQYEGALTARSRGLGGTSVLWAGKLLPLSVHDSQPRPYLNLEGWPFDVAELDLYRHEVELLMGVDDQAYDGDVAEQLDPNAYLPRSDVDFCLRWPKRPTTKRHNLAYVLRREIEELQNLEVWLGATVAGFEFDPNSGKLEKLTAINHAGRNLHVSADEYLIAAGTLETTRLLLLADRQANSAISRDCDALGGYFNDHLGLSVASLHPKNHGLTNRMLSDRSTFNSLRHLHFELRPEMQEQSNIASAYFDIGAELPEASALTKAKMVAGSLKQRKLNFGYQDVKALVLDSPSLFLTAEWEWMRKQKYWPLNAHLHLKIWVEQLPRLQNRISLSDEKDTLQIPKLKLEWRKGDSEEQTFRIMVDKIHRYWSDHMAAVCDLAWKPDTLNPHLRLVDRANDLAHPAGSTRMGASPLTSVVDTNLKVHRLPNVSVASASVFPSSGSANPTFTIMQLAMRAADAIAKRVGDGSLAQPIAVASAARA